MQPASSRRLVDPETGQAIEVLYVLPPGLCADPEGKPAVVRVGDLVRRLWHRRALVISITIVGFLTSLGLSLAAPKHYTAMVAALPPSSAAAPMLGGQYADLARMAGIPFPSNGENAVREVMAILESRTLHELLLAEFSLVEYYQQSITEDRLHAFRADFDAFHDKRSGVVTFSYTHRSPQTAADVANRACVLVQQIFNDMHQSATKRERIFLEGRLQLALRDLKLAQERLAQFQRENQAFELESQTRATVEAIGVLQGQLIGQQVELRALLGSQGGGDNPQIQLLEQRVAELAKAIGGLVGTPSGPVAAKKESGVLLGLEALPAMGVEYVTLFREVKLNEALAATLSVQVEAARISELRSQDAIAIIDSASVPERKSRPKRTLMCIIGLIVGGLIGIVAALSAEPFRALRKALRQ